MAPDTCLADYYRIARIWLRHRWRNRNRWDDWHPLDDERTAP